MRRPGSSWGALVALLCLAGCAGRQVGDGGASSQEQVRAAPSEVPEALRYEVSVDPAFEHLGVRLCIDGGRPRTLIAGFSQMARDLRDLRVEGPEGVRQLDVHFNRAELPSLSPDECLRYRILLAPSLGFQPASRREEDAISVDTRAFLWRPSRWRRDTDVHVRFELPEGMAVDVPWVPTGSGYRSDGRALGFPAQAVIGRFDTERFRAAGADVSVAILPGLSERTRAQLAPYLRRAVTAAAGALGHFAAERLQVVVIPRGFMRSADFGMLQRGGESTVLLMMGPHADLTEPEAAWVPVHEFSHLLHPFVEKSGAWLSEGLATYYQEILRARAGIITPAQAWQNLYHGARHCRGVRRTLAVESAEMRITHDYPRVYWGGAVASLRVDVALRAARDGRSRGLDGAIEALHGCCSIGTRPWSSDAVLQRLDQATGGGQFSSLAARVRREPLDALGDLDALYAELGIELRDGVAILHDDAPLAAVRDAITAPLPVALPSKPASLARRRIGASSDPGWRAR